MIEMSTTTRHTPRDTIRDDAEPTVMGGILQRTSWGAVVAGAVSAISLQFLFTVLGVALGLSIADGGEAARVTAEGAREAAEGIGIGAAVWWLVTGTISLLVGGMIVGRSSGMTRNVDVLLHSFAMWSVTAIFGFFVIWSGAGMAGNAAGQALGSPLTAAFARPMMAGAMDASGQPGGMANLARDTDTDARDRALGTNTTGENTQALRPTAAELERARENAATAAWWSVVGLLLGIAASLAGAWLTAPNRIILRSPMSGRPNPPERDRTAP